MHTKLSHDQYLQLSERTMADCFYLNNQSLINILHGAIGIQTEIAEIYEAFSEVDPEFLDEDVDMVNIVEESGDIAWYLAIIHRELDISYLDLRLHSPYQSPEEYFFVLERMNIASGNLLDMVKKKAFYDKSFELDKLKVYMSDIYSGIHWLLSNFSQKVLAEALAVNINKLEARFPEKFEIKNANVRDLDKERRILEGSTKSEEMGLGYL